MEDTEIKTDKSICQQNREMAHGQRIKLHASFLEINMEAGYQYFEISIERKNKNYFLEINFKRLCIKTLIFVLWIMTNVQCLHVPSYILQCNSYSLPLIRTLKKESMSKIRWYWIQQWENTVHGRQITNPVQIRTIFSVI